MIYSLLKLNTKFLILTTLGFGVWLFAPLVQAQVTVIDGPLTASFESTPLFGAPGEVNIAPGSTTTRAVSITNTGTVPEAVIVSVTNQFSTGLADTMMLTITDRSNGDIYFSDTISNFFLDIPVGLGVLGVGATRSYDLDTEFLGASGNTYQASTLGFDIHFGFASGASVTPPGGGGGGGSFLPPTPGVPNPGQVAGAATSTIPNWWQPVVSGIQSLFSGDGDKEGDSASEESTVDGEVAGAMTDIFGDVTSTTEFDVACLLVWLLLLVVLSIVASVADDLWRHRDSKVFLKLFVRQLVFSVVYVALVVGAYFLGWLNNVWYLLAGAWAVMQVVDYRAHAKVWETWQPLTRLLTLGGLALVLVLSSLVFGWPCVWWPFAVVAGGALLTHLLK